MTRDPEFSVVLPTYRRAHLVARALESVLTQTVPDFEVIVVDDGSPDPARDVLSTFTDPRIRHVRHEVNRGIAAARNSGIRAGSAPRIAFLDDDDEYLPSFLEETLRTYRQGGHEVGWTWCGVFNVREDGTSEPAPIWAPEFSTLEEAYLGFLRHRRVGTSSGFTARKDALLKAGLFDEALRGGAEDTDLLIRLARISRFRVVERHLLRFHDHGGPRLRRSTEEKAKDYERIIASHQSTLERHPALWGDFHYKTAWLHFHGGHPADGRRYLVRALRRRPGMWKGWLLGIGFGLLGRRAASLHRTLSGVRSRLRRESCQSSSVRDPESRAEGPRSAE